MVSMRAAFFDLDKTVIAKSSMVAFGPEFHTRGLLRRRTLLRGVFLQILFMRFGANEVRLAKIRQSVLKITKGWDHNEVRTLVAETLNEIMQPLIYSEALALIRQHQEAGDEVWLVSMSPAEIVEPFAATLGITGSISSKAVIDENGKFTGEMAFYAEGENKAIAMNEVALERDIDMSESFAYSDSETDIPMLRAVGHPFAVNPDRALVKIAHENGWPVLSFTHKVLDHDGHRSRTPFVVSAAVLGVLALIGRSQSRR